MVNGSVKRVKIGLKTVFTKPKIRAEIKIAERLGLLKYKPIPNRVVRYKANELSNSFLKKFMALLYNFCSSMYSYKSCGFYLQSLF